MSGGSLSTVGGLAGTNSGAITGSQSSVALNVPNCFFVGGLVGMNDAGGSIVNSSRERRGQRLHVRPSAGSSAPTPARSAARARAATSPADLAATVGGLAGFNTGSIENSNAQRQRDRRRGQHARWARRHERRDNHEFVRDRRRDRRPEHRGRPRRHQHRHHHRLACDRGGHRRRRLASSAVWSASTCSARSRIPTRSRT